MAKKVKPVNTLPPPSSSDEETEDEEGSTSSDDGQHQHPPQPQEPQQSSEESDDDDETEGDEPEPEPEPVVNKPSLPKPQESEESDDDSDETHDDSPRASAFTVKPIVPKPASKSPEPKTPVSKKKTRVKSRAKRPAESEETDKASKPVSKNQESGKEKVKGEGGNSKRPAEVETEKIDKVSNNKKSKVSNADGESVGKIDKGSKRKKMGSADEEGGEAEEKKGPIKWSEKDEMVLLGGIIDYKAETGDDYKVDAFYEYVIDLLSVNLTKNQLFEKIRRLKKKFENNDEKYQNGEEPVFLKPHESNLFEISRKIWGSSPTTEGNNDSKVKSSMNKDKKDGVAVGPANTPLKSLANKKDGIVATNTSTPIKSVTNREVVEEIKDTIMEDKKEDTQDYWSLYPRLCASLESEASLYSLTPRVGDLKEYVNKIIKGMGEEKARELEDAWKAVFVMDHQVYVKRTHLISKQAQAVLDFQKHLD